jgi:ferric-dicitrate binding protein FerR (iron transport regulator)
MVRGTAGDVVERLLDDDYLHEQMATGAERLRAAYHRSRALPRHEAVQDKRLYDHLREAAGSLSEAARRVAGKPRPEPPKRRGPRIAMLLIGVGLVVLVRDMHRRQQSAAATADAGS